MASLYSDVDLEPKTAYTCYSDRCLLELVFNRYKSDECLDKTNVQGGFSVIGSEFINFIATVMTCRMLRKATDAGLLEKLSYGELPSDLSEIWRDADAPEHASSGDGHWVHALKSDMEELEALGLSEPVSQQIRKNVAGHGRVSTMKLRRSAPEGVRGKN